MYRKSKYYYASDNYHSTNYLAEYIPLSSLRVALHRTSYLAAFLCLLQGIRSYGRYTTIEKTATKNHILSCSFLVFSFFWSIVYDRNFLKSLVILLHIMISLYCMLPWCKYEVCPARLWVSSTTEMAFSVIEQVLVSWFFVGNFSRGCIGRGEVLFLFHLACCCFVFRPFVHCPCRKRSMFPFWFGSRSATSKEMFESRVVSRMIDGISFRPSIHSFIHVRFSRVHLFVASFVIGRKFGGQEKWNVRYPCSVKVPVLRTTVRCYLDQVGRLRTNE